MAIFFQFDELLRKQWLCAMDQGLFTYKLDKIITRIVPGKNNIVLQVGPNFKHFLHLTKLNH